jgi:hypothetical protein
MVNKKMRIIINREETDFVSIQWLEDLFHNIMKNRIDNEDLEIGLNLTLKITKGETIIDSSPKNLDDLYLLTLSEDNIQVCNDMHYIFTNEQNNKQ